MDRDLLLHHFINLGLVIVGLLSVQQIAPAAVFILLIPGAITGFLLSWHIKGSRPQHMDTFIGMLSLASIVIIFSSMANTAVTFENLLKILSTALMWLALFQSFGLKTSKSYAAMQFISVCLLIASVSIALESETVYVIYLAAFLFLFIFAMRLNLVCEKKQSGSVIVGDQEEVMSLWNQIKITAVIFSTVLILSSAVYPFVPRFENLSLSWVPSSLLNISEKIIMLSLRKDAQKTVKEKKEIEESQPIDEQIMKRETGSMENIQQETIMRFPAVEFDKNIDVLKAVFLNITIDKKELPLDNTARLIAEIKMSDGASIPANRIVDWKVSGTAKIIIDKNSSVIPKEKGYAQISASYVGLFSNELKVNILEPTGPVYKKSFLFYILVMFFWVMFFVIIGWGIWVHRKSRRLKALAVEEPREFIKEVYDALCRGFKVYGAFRFNYFAYREFYDYVKDFLSTAPEPMRFMTECVLEARFSKHEIPVQRSYDMLKLFHEVKDILFAGKFKKAFWKRILFRISVLDVLLVAG